MIHAIILAKLKADSINNLLKIRLALKDELILNNSSLLLMKKHTKRVFLIGIVVIVLGSGYKPFLLILFGEKVSGDVVKVETQAHWYSGPASYYPAVEFITRDGLPLRFKVGSQFDYRAELMDKAEVLYLPFYPKMAEVNEFDSMWGGFLIKTVLSLLIWIAFFTSFNDFFDPIEESTFDKFRKKLKLP